jgi:hypothetical protein
MCLKTIQTVLKPEFLSYPISSTTTTRCTTFVGSRPYEDRNEAFAGTPGRMGT